MQPFKLSQCNGIVSRQVFGIVGVKLGNMVKVEKTIKLGVKNNRLNADWDEDYLLKIITGRPGLQSLKLRAL